MRNEYSSSAREKQSGVYLNFLVVDDTRRHWRSDLHIGFLTSCGERPHCLRCVTSCTLLGQSTLSAFLLHTAIPRELSPALASIAAPRALRMCVV